MDSMNQASSAMLFADQKAYDLWKAVQPKSSDYVMSVSKQYGAVISMSDHRLLEWNRFGLLQQKEGTYKSCSVSDRHRVRVRMDGTVFAEATGGDQNGETKTLSCRDAAFALACDGVTYVIDEDGFIQVYGISPYQYIDRNQVPAPPKAVESRGYYGLEEWQRDWTNLDRLAACGKMLVGLHKDGTVTIASSSSDMEKRVRSLRDVRQIACTNSSVVTLDASGNVKIIRDGLDMDFCSGAMMIAATKDTVYVLRGNGTVTATNPDDVANIWKDVLCIAASENMVAAIDRTGTLLADPANFTGKSWNGKKLNLKR